MHNNSNQAIKQSFMFFLLDQVRVSIGDLSLSILDLVKW